MRIFHKDGTLPENHRAIFVFGSNIGGIHGAGAARAAKENYGAEYGCGEGRCNQSYAIPTKDGHMHTRPLERIRDSVNVFFTYAMLHKNEEFFCTRVGCGLAGWSDSDIGPMFSNAPDNCNLPEEWRQHVRP